MSVKGKNREQENAILTVVS